MEILVCFKVLPNPDRVLEEDWEQFRLTSSLSYAGLDFNCFDESALELALQVKEQAAVQGREVTCTALTVSERIPDTIASGLYAVGFDRVLCVTEQNREFTPEKVAHLIAENAKKLHADLIFTGAAAGMAETGQVPYELGRELMLTPIAGVERVKWEDPRLHLFCRRPEGLVEDQVQPAALCVVDNSPEVLRFASLRARMKCKDCKAELLPGSGHDEPVAEPHLTRPRAGRTCTMTEFDPKTLLDTLTKIGDNSRSGEDEVHWAEHMDKLTLYARPGRGHEMQYQSLEKAWKKQRPVLTILPDSPDGRLMATLLADKKKLNCFFRGEILEVSASSVTVKKKVCGANLDWTEQLALPAVLTVPPEQKLPDLPTVELTAPRKPQWLKQEDLVEPAEENNLQTADAVVICGSGMKNKENVDKARLLARKLGAGFGLTRPAALNGWGSTTEIVGISGVRIAPRWALVLGAAGAGAFAAGIEKAGTVVAINTDEEALIFRNADLGILTDAPGAVQDLLNNL